PPTRRSSTSAARGAVRSRRWRLSSTRHRAARTGRSTSASAPRRATERHCGREGNVPLPSLCRRNARSGCRTGRGQVSLPRTGGLDLDPASTREARFNRLHEEHFEAVRRYAWRREPADADDVVAEAFLVAWRRLDDLPEDARPWLIGIARNIRLNPRRSARRRQALAARLSETVPRIVAEPAAASEEVTA